MTAQARSPVKRIFLAQFGATLGLVFALLVLDRGAAQAALMGGTICTIANTYAGWRVFTRAIPGSAYGELSNLYRAEFGKLLMIAAMCVAYFAADGDVNILAFIGGCVVAVAANAVGAATQRFDNTKLDQTNKEHGERT